MKFKKVLLISLFLCSALFAIDWGAIGAAADNLDGDYTTSQLSQGNSFDIENAHFTVDSLVPMATPDGYGRCIGTGTNATIRRSGQGGTVNYLLRTQILQTTTPRIFDVLENNTNQPITVELKIERTNATFSVVGRGSDARCVVNSGAKVSLNIVIDPSTLYCIDTDGSDITRMSSRKNGEIYSRFTTASNSVTLLTRSEATANDSCVSSTTLNEKICEGTTATTRNYNCAASGKICSNGACVTPAVVETLTCTDSDGDDRYIIGTVTLRHYRNGILSSTETMTDSCGSISTVKEQMCTGPTGTVIPGDRICDGGRICRDGRCMIEVAAPVNETLAPGTEVFCIEPSSSSSLDLTTRREVRDGTRYIGAEEISSNTMTDICINENMVRKYFCDGGMNPDHGDYACPEGTMCSNGACIIRTANEVVNETERDIDDSEEIIDRTEEIVNRTSEDVDRNRESLNRTINDTPAVNVAIIDRTTEAVTGEISLTINIEKGWNLISIPIAAPRVTSNCNEFESTRRRWNYVTAKRVWGHQSSFDAGRGYWFKADNDCRIVASGLPLRVDKIRGTKLLSGWNMLGAPEIQTSVMDLLPRCNLVNGVWSYNTELERYEKAEILLPGKGYVAKVTEDCSLGN
ncbi:MAG: hypothetical protein Q7S22_02370 [Candidatus Micrarchaeota archaeon]|nr:hypothetical protein [Candidatus Micrarchaeota archaeon]